MTLLKKAQPLLTVLLTIIVVGLLIERFVSAKKVVFINSPKVVAEYKGMKEVNEVIQRKNKSYKANMDTVYNEFQNELKEFEKKRPKMSGKELKLEQELLNNKRMQFMGYQEGTQKKMQEEESQLREQVIKKVNDQIHDYAKKKGYSYVLGATAMGNLVYADKQNDITDEIVAYLNDQYNQ